MTTRSNSTADHLASFDFPRLRLRETFGDNPSNLLVRGDNLLTMEAIAGAFEGRIDLIYVDPPFDVGVDFHMDYALSDKLDPTPVKVEVVAYRDRWGEGDQSYLSQMRSRLALMSRLLSERGALWVHCDYRVNHQLRVMLDDLFGQPCVNEIVWAYGAGGNPSNSFPHKHDYLLVYSRSGKILINKDEPIMRVPYDQSTLVTHYRATDTAGRRFRKQVKNGKAYITYADEGKLVTDVWSDIGGQTATSPIQPESTGFASQKPERLLERIIAGTTRPDYLVADFFCGSGTTGVVASRLGRRWIMADFGHQAIHTTRKRLLVQHTPFVLADLGSAEPLERHRAAGSDQVDPLEKIVREAFETAGGGRHRDAMIHVAAPDHEVNRDYLTSLAEVGHRGRIFVLAWQFAEDVSEAVARGSITPVIIPRSLLEIGSPVPAVWQSLPELKADVTVADENNQRLLKVAVRAYDPRIVALNLKNADEILEHAETNALAFIDLLALDFNPDPRAPFGYAAVQTRSRRDKRVLTDLVASGNRVAAGDSVRVRTIDIFGTETTICCRVNQGH